ncbi:hypothetical protein [Halapricum salinum]|uniref:hypothetical protein n=1 Tax=Halapricum salinum TaxID=1457250 RepID=UPI0014768D32|nr:hypothetical protein [Halapricum salinum]
MSHQPDRPREYVCEDCLSVHAAVVHGQPGDRHYEAPDECAACGSDDFVDINEYPLIE